MIEWLVWPQPQQNSSPNDSHWSSDAVSKFFGTPRDVLVTQRNQNCRIQLYPPTDHKRYHMHDVIERPGLLSLILVLVCACGCQSISIAHCCARGRFEHLAVALSASPALSHVTVFCGVSLSPCWCKVSRRGNMLITSTPGKPQIAISKLLQPMHHYQAQCRPPGLCTLAPLLCSPFHRLQVRSSAVLLRYLM